MIKAILVFNTRGQARVLRFFDSCTTELQQKLLREAFQIVSKRDLDSCNFVEYNENKLIYRHYATLYFVFAVDSTESEYDIFEICFETKLPHGQQQHHLSAQHTTKEVSIKIKHGVETKDYDTLAKANKLKPLEVELSRLEDLSAAIVSDFAYMKQREEEMRDTNESTNNKVLYFSIFSMCCLMSLAIWQVLYLRRYFKAKKLID